MSDHTAVSAALEDCVLLPCSNGRAVLIDRDVFDALDEHHRAPFWNTSSPDGPSYAYVYRARQIKKAQANPYGQRQSRAAHSQCGPLARVIAKAGRGDRIGYRNGDRSDLRASNLFWL